MKTSLALTLSLATGCLVTGIQQSANAADIVVRPPLVVVCDSGACVPRVKPASRLKQYPFGVLREDYTPYGMAGVPDRIYFTARERNLR
jgi:hypothetical protein